MARVGGMVLVSCGVIATEFAEDSVLAIGLVILSRETRLVPSI